MTEESQRIISFENIVNFRDLGGYAAQSGKKIALRKLYRSGGLLHMSQKDKARLKNEIKLKTVIDLRSPDDVQKLKASRLLEEMGAKYFNVPFRPDVPDYYQKELELCKTTSDMGEIYLYRINHITFARKLINILEIMADPQYYPLLFHCEAGKDRTGIQAALLLKLLGVFDADIINDYALTDPLTDDIKSRICLAPETTEEVKNLPDFTWRAVPEYMETFLAGLEKEYGGAKGYIKKHGADKTLVKRLEKALLF
jgi:protein-tyrosine phosphatase